MRVADALNQQAPHWVTFFREIFGVDGAVTKLFPDDRKWFEDTEDFAELQQMMRALRRGQEEKPVSQPMRMITVRLPADVHEFLRLEAWNRNVSLNSLCIAKLLQRHPDAVLSPAQEVVRSL